MRLFDLTSDRAIDAARRAAVHAADEEIDRGVLNSLEGPLVEVSRLGLPVCSPEEVDAIDEYCRLAQPDIGDRKRLADAVGFGDRIGIHQENVKPGKSSPDAQRLVEIRQPHRDGASRTAGSDDENANRSARIGAKGEYVFNAHDCPALRARIARASAATESMTRLGNACACP